MIARAVASMWLAMQVIPALCCILMARAPGMAEFCPSAAVRCEEAPPACGEATTCHSAPIETVPCSDESSWTDADHCCPLCEPICCVQGPVPPARDDSRDRGRRGLEAFDIYFSPASRPLLMAARAPRLHPSGTLRHYAVPGDRFRAMTGVWLI